MLREKAVISEIGCKELDINLLTRVFKLSPDLNKTYELSLENDNDRCDLLFINADEASALYQWQKLYDKNKTLTAIMLTEGDEKIEGYVTIKKPIAFKNVLRALNAISVGAFENTSPMSNDATLKILVVDDSLPVRKFMQNKLPELVCESLLIEFATSGEEAAHKIKQATRPYNIIFLDVVMPGVGGYKVCEWIKHNYNSHVVMLTNKKSEVDLAHGTMSGCNDYLTKPPDETHLKAILDNIIQIIRRDKQSGDIQNSAAGIQHYQG